MRYLLNRTGRVSPERAAQVQSALDREREDTRREQIKKLRRESNVFEKYANADIDDIEYVRNNFPDALQAYSQVAVELRRLLTWPQTIILRGNNGPGKTHLASALVNLFCDEMQPAYYCTAMDFYRQLKSTFGSPGKTAEELIARFRKYNLLVIDELEIRSESKWENDELRSLIDARYAGLKATVLITNKSQQELSGYLSSAICDRICESGSVVNCDWRSLRQKPISPSAG